MSIFVKSLAANGGGGTEYGLIAGLIAVAVITAVTLVGTDISAMFNGDLAGDGAQTPSS